jgi:UDP-N-acetylmuramate dehydrogenase
MSLEKGDFSERCLKILGKPVEKNVCLAEHANFGIGGSADYFFSAASVSELVNAVKLSREFSIPYFVIGGGYNLLFDNEGFRGLIIKNVARGLRKLGKRRVEALSGTHLKDLLEFCQENCFSGLEFLAGIPGTVGGAVSGNAGAFDQAIGDFLKEAFLWTEEVDPITVGRSYFDFDYRKSRLKSTKGILLKAVFELKEGIHQEIEEKMAGNIKKRQTKHPPWNVACAGSYFKNPVLPSGERTAAAYLLDQVGAKDLKMGGAAVFKEHANFIINLKQASCRDVLRLAEELKQRVKKKFGVELEEEVIYLPAEPSKL